MSGEAGKGDKQCPGEGYRDNYDLIGWGGKAPEAPEEETKGDGDE